MQKIVEATGASIGSFSSQNLSNAVMAFAKLDHHPGKLMDSIARAIIAVLHEATPQVKPPMDRFSEVPLITLLTVALSK